MKEDTQLLCPLSYEDPSSMWPLLEKDLLPKLPLRDVSLRVSSAPNAVPTVIDRLPLRCLPATASLFKDTDHPFRWFLAPYVCVYLVVCESLDAYKAMKPKLKAWVDSHSGLKKTSWLFIYLPMGSQAIDNYQKIYSRLSSEFFNERAGDRSSMVLLSGFFKSGPSATTSVASSLSEALYKIREGTVASFMQRCNQYEAEVRRLEFLRSSPQFEFKQIFLVKESLALMLQMMQLPAEALVQYEELEALLDSSAPPGLPNSNWPLFAAASSSSTTSGSTNSGSSSNSSSGGETSGSSKPSNAVSAVSTASPVRDPSDAVAVSRGSSSGKDSSAGDAASASTQLSSSSSTGGSSSSGSAANVVEKSIRGLWYEPAFQGEAVLTYSINHARMKVLKNRMGILELRHYVFARECYFYFTLNRPQMCADKALAFLAFADSHLRRRVDSGALLRTTQLDVVAATGEAIKLDAKVLREMIDLWAVTSVVKIVRAYREYVSELSRTSAAGIPGDVVGVGPASSSTAALMQPIGSIGFMTASSLGGAVSKDTARSYCNLLQMAQSKLTTSLLSRERTSLTRIRGEAVKLCETFVQWDDVNTVMDTLSAIQTNVATIGSNSSSRPPSNPKRDASPLEKLDEMLLNFAKTLRHTMQALYVTSTIPRPSVPPSNTSSASSGSSAKVSHSVPLSLPASVPPLGTINMEQSTSEDRTSSIDSKTSLSDALSNLGNQKSNEVAPPPPGRGGTPRASSSSSSSSSSSMASTWFAAEARLPAMESSVTITLIRLVAEHEIDAGRFRLAFQSKSDCADVLLCCGRFDAAREVLLDALMVDNQLAQSQSFQSGVTVPMLPPVPQSAAWDRMSSAANDITNGNNSHGTSADAPNASGVITSTLHPALLFSTQGGAWGRFRYSTLRKLLLCARILGDAALYIGTALRLLDPSMMNYLPMSVATSIFRDLLVLCKARSPSEAEVKGDFSGGLYLSLATLGPMRPHIVAAIQFQVASNNANTQQSSANASGLGSPPRPVQLLKATRIIHDEPFKVRYAQCEAGRTHLLHLVVESSFPGMVVLDDLVISYMPFSIDNTNIDNASWRNLQLWEAGMGHTSASAPTPAVTGQMPRSIECRPYVLEANNSVSATCAVGVVLKPGRQTIPMVFDASCCGEYSPAFLRMRIGSLILVERIESDINKLHNFFSSNTMLSIVQPSDPVFLSLSLPSFSPLGMIDNVYVHMGFERGDKLRNLVAHVECRELNQASADFIAAINDYDLRCAVLTTFVRCLETNGAILQSNEDYSVLKNAQFGRQNKESQMDSTLMALVKALLGLHRTNETLSTLTTSSASMAMTTESSYVNEESGAYKRSLLSRASAEVLPPQHWEIRGCADDGSVATATPIYASSAGLSSANNYSAGESKEAAANTLVLNVTHSHGSRHLTLPIIEKCTAITLKVPILYRGGDSFYQGQELRDCDYSELDSCFLLTVKIEGTVMRNGAQIPFQSRKDYTARCGAAFQISQDVLGLAGSEFFVHSTLRNRSPVRWRLQGIRTSVGTPWIENGSWAEPPAHFELNLRDVYSLESREISSHNDNVDDESYKNGSSRTVLLDTTLGVDDEFHFSSRCEHVIKSASLTRSKNSPGSNFSGGGASWEKRSEEVGPISRPLHGGVSAKTLPSSIKGAISINRTIMSGDYLPSHVTPAYVVYTLMRQSGSKNLANAGGTCTVCRDKRCTGGWGLSCIGICEAQRYIGAIYTAFADFFSSPGWDKFEIAVPVRLAYLRGAYSGVGAVSTSSKLEPQLSRTSGPSAAIVVFPSSADRSSDVGVTDLTAVPTGVSRIDAADAPAFPGSPSFAVVSIALPPLEIPASVSVGASAAFTFKISLVHYVNHREHASISASDAWIPLGRVTHTVPLCSLSELWSKTPEAKNNNMSVSGACVVECFELPLSFVPLRAGAVCLPPIHYHYQWEFFDTPPGNRLDSASSSRGNASAPTRIHPLRPLGQILRPAAIDVVIGASSDSLSNLASEGVDTAQYSSVAGSNTPPTAAVVSSASEASNVTTGALSNRDATSHNNQSKDVPNLSKISNSGCKTTALGVSPRALGQGYVYPDLKVRVQAPSHVVVPSVQTRSASGYGVAPVSSMSGAGVGMRGGVNTTLPKDPISATLTPVLGPSIVASSVGISSSVPSSPLPVGAAMMSLGPVPYSGVVHAEATNASNVPGL